MKLVMEILLDKWIEWGRMVTVNIMAVVTAVVATILIQMGVMVMILMMIQMIQATPVQKKLKGIMNVYVGAMKILEIDSKILIPI